jgi:hypothetical protein
MPIQHKPSVVQPQNALNDLPEMPALAEAVDKKAQVTALDQDKLNEWWRQVREMLRRNNAALLAQVAALAEEADIEFGTVEEAPNDGQQYARQSRDWSVVEHPETGGGVPEAPQNGQLYARRNANWSAFTPGVQEAPITGGPYGRQTATWVEIASGGGIPEAPTDGRTYTRHGLTANWIAVVEVIAAAPGTSSPEGSIIGPTRGAIYTQLDAGGTYKLRDWTFDGTPGTTTGWL